jgi:two-component system sensor histidine kinase ChiS
VNFGQRTTCSFARTAALAALICVAALFPAQAATPAACARTDIERRRLPDPIVCLRRAGIDTRDASVEDGADAAALFAHAESRLSAGRFDEAEQALDCADAVIGDDGDRTAQYELVRRRGILDYRRERIPDALKRFECALALSTAGEDRVAIARDLKNVGTSLRRLGDFHGALRALTSSLQMQRNSGEVSGAVQNNIADVYRELDQPEEAMRFYREAFSTFQSQSERIEAAHVLESMAELGLDTGDAAQSARWLEEALRAYRDGGNHAYELRVYIGLTHAALALGDIAQARRQVAAALAVATEHNLPLPAALQLQIARTARSSGDLLAASRHIRAGLAGMAEGDAERAALLEELAAIQERSGDRVAAIETLRRAHADALALSRARQDRELGWLRTRFETAERDRTIVALETDNRLRRAELRQRTLLLWLIAVSAIAALSLLSMYFLRRQHRASLDEAARRARYEEALEHYRREAEALTEDRRLLQALLDSRAEALALLDSEGQVLAVNQAACGLLGAGRDDLSGRMLTENLPVDDTMAFKRALEQMEDSQQQILPLALGAGGVAIGVELRPWEHGDGLIVIALHANAQEAPSAGESGASAAGPQPEPTRQAGEQREADAQRELFRRGLVELMLAVVEAWESTTGLHRIELAERSRIWRVGIDDGRLRARAMERYLSLAKLPSNPRWRDVLRSAYFVLGQCEKLAPEAREALQRRVDAILAMTRRDALA